MVAENELSGRIIDAAIEVHRTLGGPGLLESVYEESLAWELKQRGISVHRQVACPLVEDRIVVECKASAEDHPIHQSQVLTYLRLKKLPLGLVLNFGKATLKDGIHRVVNGL